MAKQKSHPAPAGPSPQLLAATDAFTVRYEGADHSFTKGDIVEAGHPILRGIEHLFAPVEANPVYRAPRVEEPIVEQATAAPGEKRGE